VARPLGQDRLGTARPAQGTRLANCGDRDGLTAAPLRARTSEEHERTTSLGNGKHRGGTATPRRDLPRAWHRRDQGRRWLAPALGDLEKESGLDLDNPVHLRHGKARLAGAFQALLDALRGKEVPR
jgi:hypothetical protein